MHTLSSTIPLTDQHIDALAAAFSYDLVVPDASIPKGDYVASVFKEQLCQQISSILSKSIVENIETQKAAAIAAVKTEVENQVEVTIE